MTVSSLHSNDFHSHQISIQQRTKKQKLCDAIVYLQSNWWGAFPATFWINTKKLVLIGYTQ